MFAGSILDLEPDTGYEARFTMSDPDGFIGQTAKIVTKTVSVGTRPEPKPYAGGRVFHVYPPNYKGTRIEPAFDGLMCAYNYYCVVNLGIFTNYSGSSDFYIADNYFFGRDDSTHLLGWTGPFRAQFNGVDGQIFPPVLASYTAVRLYGPGHVVAYNYIADFHDGIDVETYGNPDGSHAIDGPHYPPREYWDRRPVAIDFYNNYLTNFHDNAIEIDGSLHNVRVMRN
jgi:hypothetical protein